MSDIIRDAPLGQIIRFVTRNRVLQYPEERDDWVPPVAEYSGELPIEKRASDSPSEASTRVESPVAEPEKDLDLAQPSTQNPLATIPTQPDRPAYDADPEAARSLSRILSSPQMSRIRTQASLQNAYDDAARQETIKTHPSQALKPEKTSDNRTLVTWYTTDDQANPQNWSIKKKVFATSQIYLYTMAVYIASAIYTASIPDLIVKFNLNSQEASSGLSLYVVGYGIGALFFSPLSEIPIIGRNPPYLITFFLFCMITIPIALIENFPGFVVLRLFQGILGSPALATGGASLLDMWSLMQFPYWLTGWAGAATAGPALGPLISGFSVPATNWHWSMWEVLWLAGPIWVLLMLCLPETSSKTILLQRAKRLRARAIRQGKPDVAAQLVSQSEIDQASMTTGNVITEAIWRPFQINLLDPSVAFTSVYTGLIYGIYYSFFESFPLVYGAGLPQPSVTKGYHFNLGQQGLVYLSIAVGILLAVPVYNAYLYFDFNPKFLKELQAGRMPPPENRLKPALFATVLAPATLFWFAWTGFNSPVINWAVPTLAIVFFTVAIFIVFMCIFNYLALSYPQYGASLFAMNDAVRSCLAAGSIHYASPLYHKLGIGRGGSLLGGLMVMGVIGIFILFTKGAWLRSRSKFAAK